MKTKLIAFVAAFGLLFAVAETGHAEDRAASVKSGKLQDKAKRSLRLRTAPQLAPESRGGTLDENKGKVVYF